MNACQRPSLLNKRLGIRLNKTDGQPRKLGRGIRPKARENLVLSADYRVRV